VAVELLERLRVATRRHRLAVAGRLGLDPTEMAALWALGAADVPTPGTLRRQLVMSSGGVTALLGRLERRGALQRERHPTDGRSALLRPAPAFLAPATALLAPLASALDAVAAALDERRRQAVARFLEDVAAGIEEETRRLLAEQGDDPSARGRPVPALWA
jgi:DNA-binding MarR family transcriptional regulator